MKAQNSYVYDPAGNRTDATLIIGSPQRALPPVVNKDLPTHDLVAKQHAMTFGISIYPTMVNELLNITIVAASEYAPALVEVYDNLGRTVTTKKIDHYNQEQINFSSLKDGIYNISIKIKDQKLFYKVVKGK
ncbi:MAG: T9SS type A sorting domain-containing protein [Bacteroidetes bacterium]|nr:T9SS type A sorting domain-containing protein [Bacteroidota bacterium]